MSANCLFIVREKAKDEYKLKEISNKLIEIGLENFFGIHFNIEGYHDELLKINKADWGSYFFITDDFFSMSAEEIMNIAEVSTREELNVKFAFLDLIINCIFEKIGIDKVEFFCSDDFCFEIADYKYVKINNFKLSNALVDEIISQCEKDKLWSLPSIKFEIVK